MRRTQMYLPEAIAIKLDAIAAHKGTTRSALLRAGAEHVIASNPLPDEQEPDADLMARIREFNPTALQYITPDMPRWKKSTLAIAGIWKDRNDLDEVFADIRKSWDRDVWAEARAKDKAARLLIDNENVPTK